jgi:hypothetical protein
MVRTRCGIVDADALVLTDEASTAPAPPVLMAVLVS